MKKVLIILVVFFYLSINVQADSYLYKWNTGTTFVTVPLNANILDYLDIPKAKLYRNDKLLEDAQITYNSNGDWLYLLTDVDTSKVGDYLVWYKLSEEKYKPGQCSGYKTLVTFHVVDLESPKIIDMPLDITYRIGSVIPDYSKLITAIDNSGNCDVQIIDNVDYKTVGNYNVDVIVSDGYNVIKKIIEVKVIDEEGPRISYLGDEKGIVVSLGEELLLMEYLKAIDDIDGDVSYTIKYDPIDTSIEGINLVTVSFNDLQGNITSVDIIVNVIDDSIPTIILNSQSLLVDYLTDFNEYDFKSNIYQALAGKKDIYNSVYVDYSMIKNEVGVYSIFYCYDDGSDIHKVECKIHLLANESPIVNTQDVKIEEGGVLDYSDYIDVSDPSDISIKESTQIDDSLVDYNTSGTYPVYITVTNSSGLSTTETMFVTVVEKKKQDFDWKMAVIFVMGCYFVGSKILYFVRRKRN